MRKVAFILAMLSLATSTVSAVMVYAPNALPRPYPFSGPDDLVMFDSEHPEAFVIVGSMNVPGISFGGMDFDSEGNLWAYASLYKATGGAASGLYSVDINTGAATVQGTISPQTLQDIAFNPVDNQMYGINSQNNVTRLYTIDLTTGAVTTVGIFTGLPDPHHAMGFAIDSDGNFYLQELRTCDCIYKGTGLDLELLYELPQDTHFSQGMTIDWSRNNRGYHAAVGQGEFPNYFSQINYFAPDGSGYVLGPDFGPNEMYEGYGYPLVEPGDLAVMPATNPWCPGDINDDQQIDLSDLAQLLSGYGLTSDAQYEDGDLDGDADVDLSDLAQLLGVYGTVCQ